MAYDTHLPDILQESLLITGHRSRRVFKREFIVKIQCAELEEPLLDSAFLPNNQHQSLLQDAQRIRSARRPFSRLGELVGRNLDLALLSYIIHKAANLIQNSFVMKHVLTNNGDVFD